MNMTLQLIFTLLLILSMCCCIDAQVGDSCVLKKTRKEGVCKIETQCPHVTNQAKIGVDPTLCGFQDQTPIVCCPEGTMVPGTIDKSLLPVSKRISEQKCDEYSKTITSMFRLISLDVDPEPITSTIANCSYNQVPLIAGGEPAELGEFPFMALVGFDIITKGSPWICGGTLISDRYVLTAAHCTEYENNPPTKIRLGELDLSTENDGSQHMDYRISKVIAHPGYDWFQKYNDIALLQTQTIVVFTKFIRPACLATSGSLDIGRPLATGWGKTRFDQSASDKLLKVSLEVFDNGECGRYFKNEAELTKGILSSMVCAGEPRNSTKRKDTCPGDSGGPLLVASASNFCKFYVTGITSFGKPCGLAKIPAIYTRVSEYVSWIEKQVW